MVGVVTMRYPRSMAIVSCILFLRTKNALLSFISCLILRSHEVDRSLKEQLLPEAETDHLRRRRSKERTESTSHFDHTLNRLSSSVYTGSVLS